MSPQERDPNELSLNQIETIWTMMQQAQLDAPQGAADARNALVLRYARAVRRYIGAVTRDDHAADELAQDVMVRMMKGDFAGADPSRGRFRDFLRVAIRNMVRNYWSREQRRKGIPLEVTDDPAAPGDDEEWTQAWRQTLLDMAWEDLRRYEQRTSGSVSYILLRLRADYPDDDTTSLTERLQTATGKTFRTDAVRQQLRRARLRFAQYLVDEVVRGLDNPTPAAIEDELISGGLMPYVRDFLPNDWRTSGELA